MSDSLLLFRHTRLRIEPKAVHAVHGRNLRAAMIDGSELIAVHTGCAFMRKLIRRRLKMPFVCECAFLWGGPRHHTAGSVETGAVIDDGRVIDHSAIDIHVADHGRIHVHDCSVITKDTACPDTAHETGANIAEAIVDAAIEPNVRSPIVAAARKAVAISFFERPNTRDIPLNGFACGEFTN